MKIVISGAAGRLGAALARAYGDRFELVALNRAQLDLASPENIRRLIGDLEFDVMINAAAFTNVDLSETQRDQAFAVNAEAPKILAEICRDKKAKLIHFSTDYVFDGTKTTPYHENDKPNPISAYGESKRAGEANVLDTEGGHLVIRVSWVFGPERPSFIDAMIQRARDEETLEAVVDKFSTPTYTADIAEMLPEFFSGSRAGDSVAGGVLHFANAGECSWRDYAQYAIDCCHSLSIPVRARSVTPVQLSDMTHLRQGSGGQAKWVAKRPCYSVLGTTKFSELTGRSPRTWRAAVADYIEHSYLKK